MLSSFHGDSETDKTHVGSCPVCSSSILPSIQPLGSGCCAPATGMIASNTTPINDANKRLKFLICTNLDVLVSRIGSGLLHGENLLFGSEISAACPDSRLTRT